VYSLCGIPPVDFKTSQHKLLYKIVNTDCKLDGSCKNVVRLGKDIQGSGKVNVQLLLTRTEGKSR
jgi:hypothetical protein